MLDSRSEPCGDAVVSTGAGAITSDHRGPAAADYAVAGVGRTIPRTAEGWHVAGSWRICAPGRGFASADHTDHESAASGTGDPGAYRFSVKPQLVRALPAASCPIVG